MGDETGDSILRYSRSIILWPTQLRPLEKARRIWRKWLSLLTIQKSLELHYPHYQWRHITHITQIWFNQTGGRLITTLHPAKTRILQSAKKQRQQESKKIVNMKRIIIMYQCIIQTDTNSFASAIENLQSEVQMESSQPSTNKYQGDNQGNLLALSMALPHIVYCQKCDCPIRHPYYRGSSQKRGKAHRRAMVPPTNNL
jgi:hypothetical protein